MKKLTVHNLNQLIETIKSDNEEEILIPRTPTYREDVYINYDKFMEHQEEIEDYLRQTLPFFSKDTDKDFPLSFFQCTGERIDEKSFKKWTNNQDDVGRLALLGMYSGIISVYQKITGVDTNGEKTEFIAHKIKKKMKPAIVHASNNDSAKTEELNTLSQTNTSKIHKITPENLNRIIENCRSDTEDKMRVTGGTTYADVFLDYDKFIDNQEEIENLMRQTLPFFAKNLEKPFPVNYFQCTGERVDEKSFKEWTENPDDVARLIRLAVYSGIISPVQVLKTKDPNGNEVEFQAHTIRKPLKPIVVRQADSTSHPSEGL